MEDTDKESQRRLKQGIDRIDVVPDIIYVVRSYDLLWAREVVQALMDRDELDSPCRVIYLQPDESIEVLTDERLAAVGLQRIPKEGSVTSVAWQPIETVPNEGEFLVFMPDARPKIQVAVWHPRVKVIGGLFAFDQPPTYWLPLPAPPTEDG